MNILALPVEILDQICRYCIDSADLLALIYTCRAINGVASQLKYHSVALKENGAYVKGMRAKITTAAGIYDMLLKEGRNIRNMYIERHGDEDEDDIVNSKLIQMAMELENLESLVVEVDGSCAAKMIKLVAEINISAPTLIMIEQDLRNLEQLRKFNTLVEKKPNIRLEICGSSLVDPLRAPPYFEQIQGYMTHLSLKFATPGTTISRLNGFFVSCPYLQTIDMTHVDSLKIDTPRLVIPDSVTKLELRLDPLRKVTGSVAIAGKKLTSVTCFGVLVGKLTIENPLSYLYLSWYTGVEAEFVIQDILTFVSHHRIETIELETLYVMQLLKVRELAQLASVNLRMRSQDMYIGGYYKEMAKALPLTSGIRSLVISVRWTGEEDTIKYLAAIAARFPRLCHFEVKLWCGSGPSLPWRTWSCRILEPLQDKYKVDLEALRAVAANHANIGNGFYKLN